MTQPIDSIQARTMEWAGAWGMPELPAAVVVTLSRRLRSSLGRCRPSTGEITLNRNLLENDPNRLDEVLCHELAHVAVHLRHGAQAQPHGQEWASLVDAAGFPARVRAPEKRPPPAKPSLRRLYEHRCPVCQTVRYARRAVPQWRCAECLDAGLPGEMLITRHDSPEPTDT